MRIGIFSEAYLPLISGVVTSVVNLKEGLEALGHEVYVITPIPSKDKFENDPSVIRIPGWVIPRKSLKGFRLVPFVKRYVRKMRKLKLDVVHIHTEFSMGKLGLAVAKKERIPSVYTLHTSYQDYTHYVSKLLTRFAPNAAKKLAGKINNQYTKNCHMTIVPTKKIYDKMIRLKHDGEFTIIPSGINLKPFYKSSYTSEQVQALKDKLGIRNDEFVAILVARIAKEKSIGDLVEAFVEFYKSYPNSRFIIIGDGPDKPVLDKLIDSKKASKYINTLGFVKNTEVGLYYQIADVFLNASTTETQGLTYVEALAASLPIIVRYDDVFDAFVEDGKNGIFFNKNEELVKHLIHIRQNPEILSTLSKNAEISTKPYAKEVYAKSCETLYLDLIDKNNKKLNKK
jgi:1,2-diacylglycerol 3-alpha-glucosyltransferase